MSLNKSSEKVPRNAPNSERALVTLRPKAPSTLESFFQKSLPKVWSCDCPCVHFACSILLLIEAFFKWNTFNFQKGLLKEILQFERGLRKYE